MTQNISFILGPQAFKNLKAHYKESGVVPRVHKSKGKKAHNAYPFEVSDGVFYKSMYFYCKGFAVRMSLSFHILYN